MATPDDLNNRFMYHPPTGAKPEIYDKIRAEARSFADLLNTLCPESREKACAFTKLEEAVMWANASIARN